MSLLSSKLHGPGPLSRPLHCLIVLAVVIVAPSMLAALQNHQRSVLRVLLRAYSAASGKEPLSATAIKYLSAVRDRPCSPCRRRRRCLPACVRQRIDCPPRLTAPDARCLPRTVGAGAAPGGAVQQRRALHLPRRVSKNRITGSRVSGRRAGPAQGALPACCAAVLCRVAAL